MAGYLTASLLVALMLLHTVNSQEALIQGSCPDPANGTVGPDLLEYLIHPCRYDRWAMPRRDNDSEPFEVAVRMHIYFLGPIEPSNLHFTAHILLRLRWQDYRLRFAHFAPGLEQLVRESSSRKELWTPHLYIVNEQSSQVMGADRQDVLLTVEPDGTVLLSTRLKLTVFCIMNLQRFPFDRQECPLFLESWTYNVGELEVVWESEAPVTVNRDLHLTEYRLVNLHSNFTIANYSMRRDQSTSFSLNSRAYGKFGGNYSSLTLRFDLAREVGYHIMDYYVPSILIVAVSWVTFWLDPNAVPGRVTLGTSTMLTFITLSRNIGSSLPKVSYIKSTEIWFIVCTLFIFGSLVEFAFSNTIWRRKNNVEMKKLNSAYMIKAAMTPQPSRRRLIQSGSSLDRTQSMPSVAQAGSSGTLGTLDSNTLTVGSVDSLRTDPTLESKNDLVIPVPTFTPPPQKTTLDDNTMTPQEIAEWLDRRSRIWFPVMFLIFNILYWGFVWI